MSDQEYLKVLRRFGEIAGDLAEDELIIQRIRAIQANDRAITDPGSY